MELVIDNHAPVREFSLMARFIDHFFKSEQPLFGNVQDKGDQFIDIQINNSMNSFYGNRLIMGRKYSI